MRTYLNLLNGIQVASPCTASWDEMTGDEHARYCGHCDKNVYNLSALTTEAAFNLIQELEGKLCGRFFRRADGTILTADCPVGVHHRIQRKRRLALSVVFAGLLGLSGCSRHNDSRAGSEAPPVVERTNDANVVMGIVCIPNREAKPQVGDMVLGKIDVPAGGAPELLPQPRQVETVDK